MSFPPPSAAQQRIALWASTVSFTACFAVWTIFSIIGIQIQKQLGLNETQFGLLVATPILTGSLSRLALGVWTDQYGGRRMFVIVMLASAASTALLTTAQTYTGYLLAALAIGIAGGSFAVGVAYVSRWFPPERQGTALGIFGAGNVGSAITKLVAPLVMVSWGWHAVAQIWAAVLAVVGVLFFLVTKDDPEHLSRSRQGLRPPPFLAQLRPLRQLQVWRFSLYYFFVFGAFVALALWLPRYLVGMYDFDVRTAGVVAALYSLPASLFRIAGGFLSDRIGARRVMYWTFAVSIACTFVLSYPPTAYTVTGIERDIHFTLALGPVPFTILIFVLGLFMSFGKAAVYKHIPTYYPGSVGAVGGVVGMIGGLGGFVLPIAFGALNDLIGIWTSCFWLLFGIAAASLAWMHLTIRAMERRTFPALAEQTDLLDRVTSGTETA